MHYMINKKYQDMRYACIMHYEWLCDLKYNFHLFLKSWQNPSSSHRCLIVQQQYEHMRKKYGYYSNSKKNNLPRDHWVIRFSLHLGQTTLAKPSLYHYDSYAAVLFFAYLYILKCTQYSTAACRGTFEIFQTKNCHKRERDDCSWGF